MITSRYPEVTIFYIQNNAPAVAVAFGVVVFLGHGSEAGATSRRVQIRSGPRSEEAPSAVPKGTGRRCSPRS
jgi:hypothetical protein